MRRAPLTVMAIAMLIPRSAKATESAPEVVACETKQAGDPCKSEQPNKTGDAALEMKIVAGTCQSDQCCALDYSSGSPPKSVCSSCLACKPEEAGETPPPGEPAAAEEPPVVEPADDHGPPPPSPHGKRGCSVSEEPPQALWLLVLGLLSFLRRRMQWA